MKLFTTEHGRIFRDECNCLPSCTSIEYVVKNQRTSLNTLESQHGQPNK